MNKTIAIDQDEDKSNICAFTFSDGRRCTNLRHKSHVTLCFSHANKEDRLAHVEELGAKISDTLQSELITACSLNSALAQLFTAVAQGNIKPKTANALTYLAHAMLQTIPLAKEEFTAVFGHFTWREIAATSFPELTPKVLDPRDPSLPPAIAAELRANMRR